MVAWAETMVRGAECDRGSSNNSSDAGSGAGSGADISASELPLRMGIDSDGRLVAGVATFDAVQRLFATEEAVEELLRRGGGGAAALEGVQLSTRLKNFLLPGN